MESKSKDKIEFEVVSVKIPKSVMKLLRDSEESLGETATQYLERCIVGLVRADIDAGDCFVPTPRRLAERYNLDPVFKEITGLTVEA
ncbi:MAG: hypothetical protein ABSG57_00125 [Candidatus Bathyarchaeia archaeon]|jgi:hypothetical protein